jgi:hypothetical protein
MWNGVRSICGPIHHLKGWTCPITFFARHIGLMKAAGFMAGQKK